MKDVDVIRELGYALQAMDWPRVAELSTQLAAKIRATADPVSSAIAGALSGLRRKRRFSEMGHLAEALIETGRGTPFIRRQYAQSLIDRGLLAAAEPLLQELIINAGGTAEEDEARGLLGRTFKQQYVRGAGPDAAAVLQRAVDAYGQVYLRNRRKNFWHGINAVALVELGKRDGVTLVAPLPPNLTAKEILQTVTEVEQASASDPWLTATMLEARIALKEYEEAIALALRYVGFVGADAFEIGSTLRQLEEVWQLKDGEEPGKTLLPLLRASLLRQGSSFTGGSEAIAKEVDSVKALQKRFGDTKTQTLPWYSKGLKCCDSIARIELPNGHGKGTAWLAQMGALFPGAGNEPVLITNAHVVGDPKSPPNGSYAPNAVVANFQILKHQTKLEFLWSSPVGKYDCTVLRMTNPPPQAVPLTISSRPVQPFVPPPRIYIIGHPAGREIEFSLQDNHLLDCDQTYLHYRTPTEDGSSGSPVFDDGWEVVGLHHKGGENLPMLNGKSGTYQANEALVIGSILSAPK